MKFLVRLLSLALLAMACFALPVQSFAATDASKGTCCPIQNAGADEDTVTAVTNLIVPGMSAVELLSKGYHADRVVRGPDGSETHVFRNVRYVIKRGGQGHGIPVRIIGGLGTDLSIVLVDSLVVGWRFGS